MRFVPVKGNVRLVSMRNFQSQSGKDLTFVRIADTDTYENQEFMLSRKNKPADLVPGTDYEIAIDVDGRFTTIEFIS